MNPAPGVKNDGVKIAKTNIHWIGVCKSGHWSGGCLKDESILEEATKQVPKPHASPGRVELFWWGVPPKPSNSDPILDSK